MKLPRPAALHLLAPACVKGVALLAAAALQSSLPPQAHAQGLAAPAGPRPASAKAPPRSADYIVAVVNQELVTAGELDQRLARAQAEARRSGAALPPAAELRRRLLDELIDERVLVTHARGSGQRVDDGDIDRAVASVAAQNQLNVPALRERLQREGIDFARYRASLRDQILLERVREREVMARMQISPQDIDNHLAQQSQAAQATAQLNLAQILVAVPERADEAVQAQRRARAEQALQRVRGGEEFARVAREMSDDTQRDRGGELGLRPTERLPDLFVEAVVGLKAGDVLPRLLRSGAGFHVLKLVERRSAGAFEVAQTRARHILLRPDARLGEGAAVQRLAQMRQQVLGGAARFDDLAREHSQDGSAPAGGDLGWVATGAFVPEFEQVMNSLPLGGLSEPVVSRFGVHLIQVVDRRKIAMDAKQMREQARDALREQKFEGAFDDWLRELRARAYIELREPPQ
jgi:peptidyl-prolyl cis-trans isomerase SurA